MTRETLTDAEAVALLRGLARLSPRRAAVERAACQRGADAIEEAARLRAVLGALVTWCDRNDWGTVPKKLEAQARAALAATDTTGGE